MTCTIDTLKAEDWEAVRSIYVEGIQTGNSTFESDSPGWEEWDRAHLKEHRLVAKVNDTIVGWVAVSPVSSRCVYAGIAELSLYVAEKERGRRVGSALLEALIISTEKAGIWTLEGGIFPENVASLDLLKKFGFREVGRRERVGKMTYGPKSGMWRDVVLVERRSRTAGVG